jgi:hypothetical protein
VKKLLRGTLAATALLASVGLTSLPASAATTASWTSTQAHSTLYSSGAESSTYHTKTSPRPPSTGKITSVAYQVTPYANGNTAETVRLCYDPIYTTTHTLCQDITVTGTATLTTTTFNGLDPRGTFVFTHAVTGGTFPTASGADTVTVTYQY